jgi:hypothetical protein
MTFSFLTLVMGKKLFWFGEIERKLANLSMTTFTYRSSSYLFYGLDAQKMREVNCCPS